MRGIAVAGRRNGKTQRMLQNQNEWLRLIAERTRFVTPDGKVWQLDRIDTYQQGRIVGLREDPHGKATLKFISTWKPWLRR